MATKKATSAKKPKTATKVTTVKATSAQPKSTVKSSTKKQSSSRSQSPLTAALVAEFIGTFILAAVALAAQGNPLMLGFSLIAIVLTIGVVSGAHVNPLITAGAWVTRKIGGKRALGYIAAQVLGAMLALVVMTSYANLMGTPDPQALMMGGQQTLTEVKPVTGDKKGVWHLFFAEMIGAVIFALAVSSAIRERSNRAAQALTVGFGLLTALTIAGGAAMFAESQSILNPALAFSLQAIEYPIKDIFSILVYIISPILGGAIGFFLYDLLRTQESVNDEE